MRIPIAMLGQSGCRLDFAGTIVYVDPYLSNSVQELDAPDLERLTPIQISPDDVTDADWVLITHAHIDHCDPHSLPALALASPSARFVGPAPVRDLLIAWGIDPARVLLSEEHWQTLSEDLACRAIPAAHPELERNEKGQLACVGFLLDFFGRRIYLAGDTSVCQEVIDAVARDGEIHTAILPVNEANFFRHRRGIIGNMSVREAFQLARELGARQIIPVHWDMFASNSVHPEEIRLLHRLEFSDLKLTIRPESLNLSETDLSIVIRTLNEERYLDDLLSRIENQNTRGLHTEVIIVDSGSTDKTLEIAEAHGCNVRHIAREDFSFGRSLNVGCDAAQGDVLVFTSGHCLPDGQDWLYELTRPLLDGEVAYAYGRQVGGEDSQFSECRIFSKYYPEDPELAQKGIFCNNANAALLKSAWQKHPFDEELTGLEDMELAQRLIAEGQKVGYVPTANVLHLHDESWQAIQRRFEREAIALQKIMPNIHVSRRDALRYFVSSVIRDVRQARKENRLSSNFGDIVRYRWNQFQGVYRGNHEHRKLSHIEKEKYFYPD